MEQPTRVRYAGSPLFASLLARTLEIAGVDVHFGDVEPGDSEHGPPRVTVSYICTGSRAAVHVAVEHFLDQCEPGIAVEVLDNSDVAGDEGSDDQQPRR